MSGGYVLRVLDPPGTAYVREYTADGYAGRGHVMLTHEIDKALLFASRGEAFEFWRAQSKTHPKRADGRPNRPLTAWSVEIVPFPGTGGLSGRA